MRKSIQFIAAVLVWISAGMSSASTGLTITKGTNLLDEVRKVALTLCGKGEDRNGAITQAMAQVYGQVAEQFTQRVEATDPSLFRKLYQKWLIELANSTERRRLLANLIGELTENLDLPRDNHQINEWLVNYLITTASSMLLEEKLPLILCDLISIRGDETKCVAIKAVARVPKWFPNLRELADVAVAVDSVQNVMMSTITNIAGEVQSKLTVNNILTLSDVTFTGRADWQQLLNQVSQSRTAWEIWQHEPSEATLKLLSELRELRASLNQRIVDGNTELKGKLGSVLYIDNLRSCKLVINDVDHGVWYEVVWESVKNKGDERNPDYHTHFVAQPTTQSQQGIANCGNTCYANASLQMLYCIPNIRHTLISQGNSGGKTCEQLGVLFEAMGTESKPNNERALWGAIEENGVKIVDQKLKAGTQHDASEFIAALLEYLREEKKFDYIKQLTHWSTVGIKRSSDRSLYADESMTEPAGFLDVPVMTTLQEAIKKLGEEEQMSGDSEMDMPLRNLSGRRLAESKIKQVVNTLPPFLIIHLKRFTSGGIGRLVKIGGTCEIPESLSMEGIVPLDPSAKYRLKSVICHGGTLASGHYWNYSWDPISKEWMRFNDGATPEKYDFKRINGDIDRQGYVVLYERIG
jgi:ubiquitin C-terminal hydrolase